MSRGWNYVSGDWNAVCDVCSLKTKGSKLRLRWDGFRVCSDCFETRHPQDFIRARNDKISVAFTRPQPPDSFTTVNYVVPVSCTPLTSCGAADYAASGCARSGIVLPGLL
jgi:hypothetical protein